MAGRGKRDLEDIDGAAPEGGPLLGRRELFRRARDEAVTLGLPPGREAKVAALAAGLAAGPTMSRRALLRASAATGAALTVIDVERVLGWSWPDTFPLHEITGASPTLTASVLRREDMLALRLEFYNLVRSGSNLVRQVSTEPAYIVATMGYGSDSTPQHVADEAYREPGETPDEPGDVEARLSGASRLAFVVPATTTSVPYQLSTILGLFPQLALHVAPAALPPGATPASAPALADPGPLETRLEVPWNLVLSPHADARWSHAATPVTRNGRTELWHTRLSEGDPAGRALRAIWTEGFDRATVPDPNDPGPFRMSLRPNERWQIVRLSSDFGIAGYTPLPVQADRLMLSALGAWLDSDANWPEETFPTPDFNLLQWRHRATLGRDQFVKTVEAGFLFPFGHRAARVRITERKTQPVPTGSMAGQRAAYLRQREFIVVRQPVVTYRDDDEHEPNDGRQRPYQRVELKTLVTPDIASDRVLAPGAIFPIADGTEIPFDVVATDREGRQSEFTMPLAFVTRDGAQNSAAAIVTAYNALTGTDLDLRQRPLDGAKVAVAPGAMPGDAAVEVDSLTFGAAAPEGTIDIRTDLPFYPTWTGAVARLDAVEQIRGQGIASGVGIAPHEGYVSGGFGSSNPGEIFARIVDPFWLTFSDGGGDRSGGVITPDMYLVNLSRTMGPQGGNKVDPDPGALPTEFDPQHLLPAVKILGAIDLWEIVNVGEGFGDPSRLPSMKSRPVHPNGDTGLPPEAMETRFTYRPELKRDAAGFFDPRPDGTMTIDVTYRTPLLPPGEPVYEIVGDLRRFKILMLGKDAPFVRLTFARLTFTSRSGQKPDVHPEISQVEFDGPLKFVDSIKDYLKTPGTGPNIEVAPTHVSAGFSLQIPNIATGALTILNIVFSAGLRIPFNGTPARARFALSSREHPFLCTWIGLGGGGFFAIELGLDGIELFEMDVVGGASCAIDAVLITVEVHAYFGIHLGIGKDANGDDLIEQISYIRFGGHCNVWGFWGYTIDLYLGLAYDADRNELWGQARLTIELTYMWLTKDVELSVERRIAGPAGAAGIDPEAATATTLARTAGSGGSGIVLASATTGAGTTSSTAAPTPPPLGFGTLVSQNDWNAYAAAFASDR